MGVQDDVANMQDLDRLYATIKSEHGQIDILFANAGLSNVTLFGQVTLAKSPKKTLTCTSTST
jgi:NAD(P)-dependent dehydrogenase (short-subunit alcohol dehydrogenase family)